MLSEKKDFFLEQLEPTHISHILLEEEAFSVDDHDAVNNKTNRREKIEALLDILKNDGSELTFETFIFALRNNIFIMNNLQPGAEIQSKIDTFSISILQNLLYISEIELHFLHFSICADTCTLYFSTFKKKCQI